MASSLLQLAEEVDQAAETLLQPWRESGEMTAAAFQLRYLYANAVRARGTARSLWLLYAQDRFFDTHNLARTLFERSVNGYVALKSPERAVALIASEIQSEIAALRRMTANPAIGQVPQLQAEVTRRESDLQVLFSLAGISEARRLDRADLAREAGKTEVHIGWYWLLCHYTHPHYATSLTKQEEEDLAIMTYIALMGPIETAATFNKAATGIDFPDWCHALVARVTEATVAPAS